MSMELSANLPLPSGRGVLRLRLTTPITEADWDYFVAAFAAAKYCVVERPDEPDGGPPVGRLGKATEPGTAVPDPT